MGALVVLQVLIVVLLIDTMTAVSVQNVPIIVLPAMLLDVSPALQATTHAVLSVDSITQSIVRIATQSVMDAIYMGVLLAPPVLAVVQPFDSII